MKSKLMAACMTLTAFVAFAVVPALASARPVLTQPTGAALAAGTTIVGTNVGYFTMTSNQGNISCSQMVLKGTLTKNSTVEGAEIDITSGSVSNGSEPECLSWTGGITVNLNPGTNGFPWCIKATASTDTISLNGGSCGGVSRPIRLTFVFTNALIGTCVYQRVETASGTLVTDGMGIGENSVGLTKQSWAKFEGGGGCPSSTEFDWTISIETENGSQVFISS